MNIDLFNNILETLGGTIVIDTNYRVIYMNDNYAGLFKLDKQYSIGKKIFDIIPNESLSKVLETGKENYEEIFEINGKKIIINRLLLKDYENNIIGAFAFTSVGLRLSGKNLEDRLEFLNKQLLFYKDNYKDSRKAKYNIDQIITKNDSFKKLLELVKKVSGTKSNVLIISDSGTGKELLAHSIHNLSERKNMPFVILNCAAIPENLIESELFGYAEGSFTGAIKGGKKGKIEMAEGGTLFLDEINSMPLNLQSKLLRVIQEKEVQIIGGNIKRIDVRFIFTSNQDLSALVKAGKFREDLYYRINVIQLKIPPLRERKEDIPILVNHFIYKLNDELGLNITGISDDVMELLCSYNWPGNVRELENTVERALNYAVSGQLRLEHFDILNLKINIENKSMNGKFSLKKVREEAEVSAIIKALKICGGNKVEASKILEVDRSVLYDKIKKYGINL